MNSKVNMVDDMYMYDRHYFSCGYNTGVFPFLLGMPLHFMFVNLQNEVILGNNTDP